MPAGLLNLASGRYMYGNVIIYLGWRLSNWRQNTSNLVMNKFKKHVVTCNKEQKLSQSQDKKLNGGD